MGLARTVHDRLPLIGPLVARIIGCGLASTLRGERPMFITVNIAANLVLLTHGHPMMQALDYGQPGSPLVLI